MLTTLPVDVVEPLVLVELPLSALPVAGSPMTPPFSQPAAVEIGNVHTLLTQGYSAKEQGKLKALLHLR